MSHFETTIQNTKGCFIKPKRSYQEIINYLNSHWTPSSKNSFLKINNLLGNIIQQLPSILITGTSGKSTTIYYLTKLLCTEGLQVGSFTTPHFALYNERIAINGNLISNDAFTSLANTVLDLLETHKIKASSKEILTAVSALYFQKEKVDIVLFEQEEYDSYDPVTACSASIIGITRIVSDTTTQTNLLVDTIMQSVTPKTYVIAADQSKLLLQELLTRVDKQQGNWIMPIRKLAHLPYPYEQLYGRCAALAERITQTYFEHISPEKLSTNSLLQATKKQRGRPSLKQKQQSNTQNSIEQFWSNVETTIPYRFHITATKKAMVLIDNAYNLDALENLFLGIRLLHYKKPFKKVAFIFGCHAEQLNHNNFIKKLRYFFKKSSAKLLFCPAKSTIGEQQGKSWNYEQIVLSVQSVKIKATAYESLKQAHDSIMKQLNDPQDLLVITGSQAIVSEYWKLYA